MFRVCLKSFLIPDFGRFWQILAYFVLFLPKSGIKKDLRQALRKKYFIWHN
jgi:hypothetical protein